MFAHTAAKRRIANVAGSVTLHPKKCNKARQNRILPSVTSKMRRAHFPNECDLSHERGRKEWRGDHAVLMP